MIFVRLGTPLRPPQKAKMKKYCVMPNGRSPADSGCSLRDPCRSALRRYCRKTPIFASITIIEAAQPPRRFLVRGPAFSSSCRPVSFVASPLGHPMSIEASAPIEPFFRKWPVQGFLNTSAHFYRSASNRLSPIAASVVGYQAFDLTPLTPAALSCLARPQHQFCGA
jgi:hypothetical protein